MEMSKVPMDKTPNAKQKKKRKVGNEAMECWRQASKCNSHACRSGWLPEMGTHRFKGKNAASYLHQRERSLCPDSLFQAGAGHGVQTCPTSLVAFTYGLLEEYGWRGFLQYELRNLPVWQYVLIITVMWFLWHLDLNLLNVSFFLLLLFASWGIGKVVSETHS